jgi:hypothetical protein
VSDRSASIRAIEIFAEITTVDVYVWYKLMSDEVRMHQILSGAIGINLVRR